MLTDATTPQDYQLVREDIKMILPNIDWDESCFLGPVFLRLVRPKLKISFQGCQKRQRLFFVLRAFLTKHLLFFRQLNTNRAGMRPELMTRVMERVEQRVLQ